jgi:hypothetical protein
MVQAPRVSPYLHGENIQITISDCRKAGVWDIRTAWLCRNLLLLLCATIHSIADPYTARYLKHVALKFGTPEGELRALKHFRTIKMSYVGSLLIRRMLDEFQVEG